MTENKHTEFKQKVTPELEKEVVAFLNSNEGGVIYIGIDKNGIPVGVNNADQEQLLIKDRLKTNILPSCLGLFDLIIEKKDNKEIIKIIVAGGYEKPYYIKKYGLSEKGAFIRIGSSAEPMPTRQIEQLFSKRIRNSIGNMKSPKQTLQFQQLHIYYQSIGKALNEQFARNLELVTEEGDYNYVAYLMNDINNISVKVARYQGLNRVELEESNEYGYESLIKATHQVLDKLNLENRTLTKITPKQRKEQRLWNAIALREAVINAFVHNDYTKEVAPKFEIFDDRLEITSYGSLPEGLSKDEFFEGYSIIRNKELMRIFKDLDLVEQLGSGIPRIIQAYAQDCFHFSENFLRVTLPSTESVTRIEQDTEQDTEQVTEQVRFLISSMADKKYSSAELMELVGIKHRPTFLYNYLQPALKSGLIALSIPDKPTSRNQKYYLTEKGKQNQKA
ncbi:putative DNA binding domain-containing protein [Flavobacterium sp. xlx-214]|uniref:Fic family protein n=1 Tax=unclassified Flavobacterium TaxID=196869 RepID=UPI0013D515F9|nr:MULTISPECIES: RNA-binding domain-containing protein [unclassified Flavobacterium]MBA5791672.1 putative DNA binding domain-containing protein [Flavobacterium sp. xlx-221]QMI82915.1 putative DNA binding domain-containing protein [Flavobacterium sp. xlx-214]